MYKKQYPKIHFICTKNSFQKIIGLPIFIITPIFFCSILSYSYIREKDFALSGRGLFISFPYYKRKHVELEITVLTINTWCLPFNTTKEARLKAICPAIKKLNPDIVLMQELWEKQDYEYIIKNCGYVYFTDYGSFPYIGNYAGMAILSKYPIAKTIKIDYLWKNVLPNYVKAAMRAEIIVEGRKIFVFNTHLTANLEVSIGNDKNIFGKIMFTSDSEEGTREGQLKTLTKFIEKTRKEEGKNIILGGDLNTGPRYKLWYRWHKWLQKNYLNLYSTMSYVRRVPSTYINDFARQDQGQLDHIFAFGSARVREVEVVLKERYFMPVKGGQKKLNISDHYGLLGKIKLGF